MTLTVGQIIEFLMGPFGTLFLVLFVLWAGYKGYWVFGWYAKEQNKRIERLENRVDNVSREAGKITSLATSVTDKLVDSNSSNSSVGSGGGTS